MRYTRMLGKMLAFARRQRVGMLGMSLLSLLLLDPGRAQALSLTVDFPPSNVSFFIGQYVYPDNTPFNVNQVGSTLSFTNLTFGSVSAGATRFDFLLLSQPTGTLNANGSYTSNPFNVQIKQYLDAALISTDTITNFLLTTEDIMRPTCGSNAATTLTDSFRLSGGMIALMGSKCVSTLNGAPLDAPFTVRLQGALPVVLPEPYLAVLLGIALVALAVPARSRARRS